MRSITTFRAEVIFISPGRLRHASDRVGDAISNEEVDWSHIRWSQPLLLLRRDAES